MKTKLLIFGLILSLLVSNVSFAEELDLDAAKDKLRKGTTLLRKIDSSLKSEEKTFRDVRENIKQVKVRIQKTREKIQTLKGQLQNIQSLISESSRKILAIRKQMAERRNELFELRRAVEKKKEEKEFAQEKYLARTDRLQDDFGLVSVLLAFGNLADHFQEKFYLGLENEENKRNLENVSRASFELQLTQEKLIEKYGVLQQLKGKQETELRNLQFHQEAKKRLLSSTKGQEEIYRHLLEQAKQEQSDVQKNVENLKSNFKFVEEKLKKLRGDELLQDAFSVEDFEDALRSVPLKTDAVLRWPVSPIRGISAHFHDEAYRKTMGIPHNAVDIRVPQETTVKASMAGVVLKVRDNDIGYNYVLLAHRDGLLTLYGHLTSIMVKEGETVFTGEPIAKSGGIPGTRGAGWLTTGAHLHFEVFKDWKHVDPLEYLPLEFLPIEYVPEQYLPKLVGEEQKVKRVQERKVRRAV